MQTQVQKSLSIYAPEARSELLSVLAEATPFEARAEFSEYRRIGKSSVVQLTGEGVKYALDLWDKKRTTGEISPIASHYASLDAISPYKTGTEEAALLQGLHDFLGDDIVAIRNPDGSIEYDIRDYVNSAATPMKMERAVDVVTEHHKERDYKTKMAAVAIAAGALIAGIYGALKFGKSGPASVPNVVDGAKDAVGGAVGSGTDDVITVYVCQVPSSGDSDHDGVDNYIRVAGRSDGIKRHDMPKKDLYDVSYEAKATEEQLANIGEDAIVKFRGGVSDTQEWGSPGYGKPYGFFDDEIHGGEVVEYIPNGVTNQCDNWKN